MIRQHTLSFYLSLNPEAKRKVSMVYGRVIKAVESHHGCDVVGVNVFDLAQFLPVQAGVEVDAAAVADGNDATVAGQAGKVTTKFQQDPIQKSSR